MKYFQTFLRNMFDKGGVLAVGMVCLYFQRKQYIPKVFRRISYGIISIGTIAISRHILMDFNVSEKSRISDCLLEEISDKLQKMKFQEHRKKEILEHLHRILSEKERKITEQPGEKELDIFSQEFLQRLEKEMQLKPEEGDYLQQCFKSFQVYLSLNNLRKSEESRSDDSDIEIINKEEIKNV